MKTIHALLGTTTVISLLLSANLSAQGNSTHYEARALLQLMQLSGSLDIRRQNRQESPALSVREAVRRQLIRDITLSD